MRGRLFTLLGTVGILSVLVAASIVWLIVQQPAAVADAVSNGELQPLLASLARELGALARALVKLL